MKITVDTLQDDPEHIKKLIEFLSSIIKNKEEIKQNFMPEQTEGFMNLFSQEQKQEKNKEDKPTLEFY